MNKKVVVVKNLENAKLRGVESYGMVLVAEDKDDNIELISPNVKVGSKLHLEGSESSPLKKINFKQFLEVSLKVTEGNVLSEGKKIFVDEKEIKLSKVLEGNVS